MELTGDALEPAGDGLTIIAYTAESGNAAEEKLALLASWRMSEVAVMNNGPNR